MKTPKTAPQAPTKVTPCLGFNKLLNITPFQLKQIHTIAGAVSEIGIAGKALDQWPVSALQIVADNVSDLIEEIQDENEASRQEAADE